MTTPCQFLADPRCNDASSVADMTAAVMTEWSKGQDTWEIAQSLFLPDFEDLEWFEALVTAVLRAEQDRRYRLRKSGVA